MVLFQPEGWPEARSVWRVREPDAEGWRPCGCALERLNVRIMKSLCDVEPVPMRCSVAELRGHSSALPHGSAAVPRPRGVPWFTVRFVFTVERSPHFRSDRPQAVSVEVAELAEPHRWGAGVTGASAVGGKHPT